MSIRVAIVGPTGYTGLHLIQILLRHPGARLTYLASHRDELPDISEEFPQLLGRLPGEVAVCKPIDPQAIARAADVAFLALPHRAAMACAPQLLDAGVRVVDLSADYRLKDQATYERVYQTPHEDQANLAQAVYGLPELYRDEIPDAALIANPGCYPTATALGVMPLLSRGLAKTQGIIINAASGVTGAGRKPGPRFHYPEHNLAFTAYGTIGGHRHQCEIEQTLGVIAGCEMHTLFVPHLLPVDQGIYATIYLDPVDPAITEEDLFEAFEDAYDDEPFVRVRVDLPNIRYVRDTNFCDVTVRLTCGKIVVFSTIDNMVKGASGQAVQNMNLMFEQDETAGLV
jgi:N-acetyl-gamma-glutamyl-phosphate reductase